MSSVSRSVYQKLKEENKRLLDDIRILTDPIPDEKFMPVLVKWRKKFQEESELNKMLHEIAVQYLKDHPEYDIKKMPNGTKKLD
jgi:hypothetical protein